MAQKGIILLALLALTGCDSVENGVCPAVVRPAIVVEVRDAVTGTGIAAGSEGLAIDGAYQDVLEVSEFDSTGTATALAGAYERPGTYRVTLEKEGYRGWSRDGIKTRSDQCGVQPVRVVAELEKI